MDFKTLFTVLVSAFLIQAVALMQTWRQNREEIGIRDWAIAAIWMSLGSLLSAIGLYMHDSHNSQLNGLPSELFRIVGASTGTTGWYYVWTGVRHFYRKPTLGYKPVAPFMVLFTLLLALELFLPVLPDWRVIWAAGVIALFSTLTLYEFLQRRLLSNPIILLMITMLFFTSGSWLLRALVSLDHTAHMTRYAFVDPLSLYDAIVASVTLTVSMIVLTNERINQQLWNQASRDPLTGVMNRRAFYEASAPLLAELHREPINLSVCVLDIDHFKKLNDNHGHAVGDLILKEFVRTARTTLREGDLFARYGGEEFVILLHNSDLQQAQHALQRLREACVNQGIMAGEQQVSVTFSAGICHATGPAQVSLDTLLEAADRAMYQAKKAGRDRIIVSPEHHGAPPPLAATSGANS